MVKVQGITTARLIYSWLAKVTYCVDGKRWTRYKIQWKNIIPSWVFSPELNWQRGALAFDGASTTSGENVTSLSFTGHAVAGSDRLLLAAVHSDQGPTAQTPTWNGDSMTALDSSQYFFKTFKLLAPDTGANTWAISSMTSGDYAATIISFTGADQTTPLDAADKTFGNGTSASNDVASEADDLVVDFITTSNTTNLAPGGSQTERADTTIAGIHAGCSTIPGAASVTMTWSWTTTSDWDIVAYNINASATIFIPKVITF